MDCLGNISVDTLHKADTEVDDDHDDDDDDNNNSNNNSNNNRVMRSLRKNLKAVPGKQSIDSLQKTAILGTSHIIRKVLQSEA
jgi:hypothetical protein